MAAVEVGKRAYITWAPPWSKRPQKMGRLAYPPGTTPPHLRPYLLKKGDVSPCVAAGKAQGKSGQDLIKYIYNCVGDKKAKGARQVAELR
jgi:hypothetical protein